MVKINHNFDPAQFKWLWAKYVKAGNIEKHCTACMIGPYSKKFSGATNPKMKEQPVLIMDEVPEDQFEAIYFCGVLKKGYLNKNLEKNNYQHNVHFAVRPVEGAHAVWDFENWHVEIEGGVLEHIPATYELNDKFFKEPYTSHYYTCRIFRWMVGHFFPQELRDLSFGLPEKIRLTNESGCDGAMVFAKDLVKMYIQRGYNVAEFYFNEEDGDSICEVWRSQAEKANDESLSRQSILNRQLFSRKDFFDKCVVNDWLIFDDCAKIHDCDGNELEVQMAGIYDVTPISFEMACHLYRIGVNEFLDMVAPYQDRDLYFNPRIIYKAD